MRRSALLAVTSAVVLVAACGSDDEDPTGPAVNPLVGRYVLTTTNGQPLPHQFPPDSSLDFDAADTLIYNERWSQDDYDLKANGRFENAFAVAFSEHWKRGATEPWNFIVDATFLGNWQQAGEEVRLIADNVVYQGTRQRPDEPDTTFFFWPRLATSRSAERARTNRSDPTPRSSSTIRCSTSASSRWNGW